MDNNDDNLTQVPDAEEMDENIHRLVVVGGVEHKLLLQVKKSSITCHFVRFLLDKCQMYFYLKQTIDYLSMYTHFYFTSRVQNKQKLVYLVGGKMYSTHALLADKIEK